MSFDAITSFFQVNSGSDLEVVRATFLISLLISLLVYHARENTPAGMITPGLFVILVGYPDKLLFLLITTVLCFLSLIVVERAFRNTIFTRTERILILVLFSAIYVSLFYAFFELGADNVTEGALGVVIPALLSERLSTVHKWEVARSLVLALILTMLAFIVLKLIVMYLLPAAIVDFYDSLYSMHNPFSKSSTLYLYLLFGLATAFNLILYRWKKFKSVGILVGAYIGILVFQPAQLLFLLTVVGASVLIVKLIAKEMLMYGYRIFVVSTFITVIVYSFVETFLLIITKASFTPYLGFHIAGIAACSVLTSEAIQLGVKRSLINTLLMIIVVVLGTLVFWSVCWLLGIPFLLIDEIRGA